MHSIPLNPPSRRTRIAVVMVAAVALIAGSGAVQAISSKGSQQLTQTQVAGSAETGDYFGASLAVGDFNGDGYGDVLVGSPLEDKGRKRDAGQVHVIYGTRSGLGSSSTTIDQGTRGVPGSIDSDDRFGSSVAVGDFDNDGYDDAVVGAEGEDVGKRRDAGAFTVLYGHRSGLRGTGAKTFTANTKGIGGQAEAHANLGSTAVVGDFNRDGRDDVAVGAPGAGGNNAMNAGAVHVLYGSKRGIRTGGSQRLVQGAANAPEQSEAGDRFGASLAVGDFNGDRRGDLAVGAPGESLDGHDGAGLVIVFSGTKKGISASSGVVVTQDSGDLADDVEMDDRFGASLAAGNFDGDKDDDLAIGSPGESVGSKAAAGRIHVLLGAKAGIRLTGSKSFTQQTKGIAGVAKPGDEFGASLVAGRFDKNRREDLAVGAPGEDRKGANGAGIVYVLFGSGSGISAKGDKTYTPGRKGIPGKPASNGAFSRSLASGDIDGDGRWDLVGGAPGQKVGKGANAGSLIVIFG